MCLTETATVVSHADGESVVLVAGVERRLPNLLVPDARPGDLVVVGMGLVLGHALVGDVPSGPPPAPEAPVEAPR
jgi:hypothetical protein